MHFVFDGGTLAADTPIRLQAEELDDYRFVELSQLDDYLPPLISARVAAAVRGPGRRRRPPTCPGPAGTRRVRPAS